MLENRAFWWFYKLFCAFTIVIQGVFRIFAPEILNSFSNPQTIMAPDYLYLNSRDELLRIRVDSIVYFEADGNYTNIVLANKLKGTVCMNLSQMQKVLSEQLKEKAKHFARIGKRHIVNLHFIYAIQVLKQHLVLSDQKLFAFQLNVSREALKTLKALMVGGKERRSLPPAPSERGGEVRCKM